MSETFGTVTIVGVGLLGGSIGLGLKKRGLVDRVRGIGSRPATLAKALEVGAVDEISEDWVHAATGADLIILCTPPAKVIEDLDSLRAVCGKHTVVTDVASTKSAICAHMREGWSDPYRFVGSHPMAGSEKSGPEHADPELFAGAVTFVEEMNDHDPECYDRVIALWRALGSMVQLVDPEIHDKLVAKTSHVPHLLASLMAQLDEDPLTVRPYIGNGFRDATRIAEGRPEIWRDISLTNAAAIAEQLRAVRGRLDELLAALESEDGDKLLEILEAGVDARKDILG
jgi:prephenate dehydrogenase